MEFQAFPKIHRLSRGCVISEKIDGTNAQICITEDDQFLTGSRNRWITPESDNFGFSRWAHENKEELLKLGYGTHYGEWWGEGIQRRYGLKEKRFSLFNIGRWGEMYKAHLAGHDTQFPKCCHVVPVLAEGVLDTALVDSVMAKLKAEGSVAAPGFMDPEGIVIYHIQARMMLKKTFKNDENGKGE